MHTMLDMHMHAMHYRYMKKLETYLKDNKITDSAFGERIGLSQSQVSRIKRGLSWPPKNVLSLIISATNGEVTADDLIREEAAQ